MTKAVPVPAELQILTEAKGTPSMVVMLSSEDRTLPAESQLAHGDGLAQLETRSSETLEQEKQLEMELQRSLYRQLGRLGCRVDQGVATLYGRVDSFFLKQMAQERAARVSNIRRVVNLVEVVER